MEGARALFPRVLIQWEDFRKGNAAALLERYRDRLPSFNDDMQGTSAMALAGVLAAGRASGTPLRDQRVVILGAGAAGVGIARLLQSAMRVAGLEGDPLLRAIALVDVQGLVVEEPGGEAFRRGLAWPPELARRAGLVPGQRQDLVEIVRALRPTVLIGVSGAAGAFREAVVRAMAHHVDRPAIFPLSNPTSQAEATPSDLLQWTEGRALVASGSPFDPVAAGGRTVRIGQGNNAFIFPGVGLGALVAEARVVTDGMFAAAAVSLAEQVSPADLAAGSLFPPVSELRQVSARVAEAVVRRAVAEGVGRAFRDDEVEGAVAAMRWEPEYPALEPAGSSA